MLSVDLPLRLLCPCSCHPAVPTPGTKWTEYHVCECVCWALSGLRRAFWFSVYKVTAVSLPMPSCVYNGGKSRRTAATPTYILPAKHLIAPLCLAALSVFDSLLSPRGPQTCRRSTRRSARPVAPSPPTRLSLGAVAFSGRCSCG